MQNTVHYFTSLILLLGSSLVYQAVTDQVLSPPKVAVMPVDSNFTSDTNLISDLFDADDWQMSGDCKRLHTNNGVLVFQNLEQTDEEQWKLWPVTLVVGRGLSGSSDPDPIIMDAPNGAELKFTESLEISSGNAPPIDRGRLIGDVRIYRNSSKSQRSLSILTSNVGINSRKIWTTEKIDMNVGAAHMLGRDLTLFLAVSASNATQGGSSKAAVLDRMELTYLDKLTMPLERGPLWQPSGIPDQPTRLPTTRKASPLPAMIKVKCEGRVDYDFQLDQLSMRNSISLVHFVPGGMQDRFDCDGIDLSLRNPYDEQMVRKTPLDWIRRIRAIGSPAKAVLNSFDMELNAERIDFDAVAGLVHASGKRGVRVRRGAIAANLQQLTYQYDVNRPKSIGAIDAFGAGTVKVSDDEMMLREMSWKEGFQLRASESIAVTPNLESLELWVGGAVNAMFVDGGHFKANVVEGFLTPEQTPNLDEQKKPLFPKLIPQRMEATGAVEIETAALAAKTEVLQLFFEQAKPGSEVTKVESKSASPLTKLVAQPEADADDKAAAKSVSAPIVRGDSVSAKIVLHKTNAIARDLSVNGNVKVEHVVNAGGKDLPAILRGQELRLVNDPGKELIQLGSGVDAPARLDLGDGYFVGPMILVWPGENYVQIRGAGEFRMPREILPTGLSGEQDSNQIYWHKPPHLSWNGEMRFDGRTAILTDGVLVKATMINQNEPWNVRMEGEELRLVLMEDVKITEIQGVRQTGIQQITMRQSEKHPLLVTADHSAGDGVLLSRHALHMPVLSLLPSEGAKLKGIGPGWYRFLV